MKIRFLFALIMTSTVPWRLLAAEMPTNELKLVTSVLQPILAKLEPKTDITYPNSSPTLVVAYRSQPFKIHSVSKSGNISTNAYDRIGPSVEGFVLQVHLQNKGDVNQAMTPQTLHEPYWLTDLNVTPLAGTQKQLFWGLSYGSRTDTNLLSQLRRKLDALKDDRKL